MSRITRIHNRNAEADNTIDYVEITTDIVTAYLSKNHVPVSDLPILLSGVHSALVSLNRDSDVTEPAVERPTLAQIRKSIQHDTLISFIDGKPYKTLKRHLTKYGLTMDRYRQQFGLPVDYPSTSPSYSERRSALAKGLGLSRKLESEESRIDVDE